MSRNNQLEANGNGCPIARMPQCQSCLACMKCDSDSSKNEEDNTLGNLFLMIIALAVLGFLFNRNNPNELNPRPVSNVDRIQLQQNDYFERSDRNN